MDLSSLHIWGGLLDDVLDICFTNAWSFEIVTLFVTLRLVSSRRNNRRLDIRIFVTRTFISVIYSSGVRPAGERGTPASSVGAWHASLAVLQRERAEDRGAQRRTQRHADMQWHARGRVHADGLVPVHPRADADLH